MTGHAAGRDAAPVLDHAAAARALGGTPHVASERVAEVDVPEPLASVVAFLDEQADGREFVPTAELVAALDVEPTAFGTRMRELGCRSTRERVTTRDGVRQVRGYLVADVRAAVQAARDTAVLDAEVVEDAR